MKSQTELPKSPLLREPTPRSTEVEVDLDQFIDYAIEVAQLFEGADLVLSGAWEEAEVAKFKAAGLHGTWKRRRTQ